MLSSSNDCFMINCIVFLLHCNSYKGGGTVRSHLDLVKLLSERGIDVHTILPSWRNTHDSEVLSYLDDLVNSGSCIHQVSNLIPWLTKDFNATRLSLKQLLQSSACPEISKILLKVKPDLCITQTGLFPQLALSSLNHNIRHVWYVREYGDLDYSLDLIINPLLTGILYNALSHHVIYNSKHVLEYFEDHSQYAYNSSVVPPWPLLKQPTGRKRKRGSPGAGPIKISVLGALVKNKNHLFLLKSLVSRSELTDGSIQLFIYGEGPEASMLSQFITDNNLAGCVFLKGHVVDLDDVYKNTDLVLVPALHEAFGRTPIEAACYGVPSICANTSGISEYIQHGTNGWTFDPNNEECLSSLLLGMLSDRGAISAAGDRACESFANAQMVRISFSCFLSTCDNVCAQVTYLAEPIFVLVRSLIKDMMSSEISSVNRLGVDPLRRMRMKAGKLLKYLGDKLGLRS